MTAIETESTVQPPRFREAFIRLLPQIRAVPEASFLTINIDVPSAVTTVLGAWREIRELRPQIIADVPSFDIGQFDSLEPYALALGHAQTVYQTATEPPASLVALAEEALKWREVLFADVGALIARGLLSPAVLKDLKGVNGYKNIGFELFALANILELNWAKVSERTGVKRAEVDEAQVVADKLITAVGQREQAPQVAAEAVRDRQATFTLLMNAYDESRWVISYLRRKQGDLESIAPSLYTGRVATKKKAAEVDKDQPAAVAQATPVVAGAAPTAAGSNGGATAAHAADVAAAGPYV